MSSLPFTYALQPDLRLVVLAVTVAMATGVVSLSILRHASKGFGVRYVGWLILAGTLAALGVWAAHVLAILAQGDEGPLSFDGVLMGAALAVAVILMCAGFALAGGQTRPKPALGGVVCGTGMSAMHYLGMAAFMVPTAMVWDVPLVIASVIFGAGFSSASLITLQRLAKRASLWWAAGLLTLAFLGLHFAAMQAVHFTPDPLASMIPGGGDRWVLTALILGAALVVLLLGAAAVLIDRQVMHDNVMTMQQLVDSAIEGIVVLRDGRITRVNRRMNELFGLAPEALLGRPVDARLLAWPVEDGETKESRLCMADGTRIPVKVAHRKLTCGDEVYAIYDLRERRAVEAQLQCRNRELAERKEELRARNLMLDTALKHMSQGLCMYDKEERIVMCNERYANVYGLAPDAIRPGMTRRQVIEMRIAHGVWGGESPESYMRERTAPVKAAAQNLQELNNGRSISLISVPTPDGGWVCTHEDVTERQHVQETIDYLARHDGLTNLPNRVLLCELLQESLRCLCPREGLAVHCLDLDRFKEVNDALGHSVGDELLQAFGARLCDFAGESNLVARIAADEFVIVQMAASSPQDASEFAAAITARMSESFTLSDQFQVVVGVSIGIAMAPGDGSEPDQLLKNANLALGRAKQEQRGTYRFFEKDMDARMRARHELECSLRNALADGELDLDYQPLLNLNRNEISCFEALLRWRKPDGQVISPGEFVPLAEETGLILPIGEWALRRALAEAANWPRQIRLAVNLSPVQFKSRNLAQVIMGALAAAGVEARRLELEITESVLLQDCEATLATLHQLRDLGVRIALDDFGTGFSSLKYLRSFPFDKIKIDRCFITGLAEQGSEESLAIVRAVAQLGTSLGVATVAEGVESQEQCEIARREGFTEVQGYWIGRPRSAAAVAAEYGPEPREVKEVWTVAPSGVVRMPTSKPARVAEPGLSRTRRARRARRA